MILFKRILQFVEDQHTRKTFMFSSQVHPAFMEPPKKPCEQPCGCEAKTFEPESYKSQRNVLQDVRDCYCQRAVYQVVEF
ncbi:hypothetical protein [Reinekea marinisedimentorum]|uniref:hypothetical protein n=1 Tax=Reinekea marinisedimentorum TaxID=230495 RepID=UPI0010509B78|nr:hypothetical protein [Reinekea marinisedimentorum]